MKTNSLTVTTSQSRELVTITVRNPFTWKNVAKLYSKILPAFLNFNQVSKQDAKFITKSLLFGLFFGSTVYYIFPLLLTILG